MYNVILFVYRPYLPWKVTGKVSVQTASSKEDLHSWVVEIFKECGHKLMSMSECLCKSIWDIRV